MAQLIIPERYRAAHQQGLTHYLDTGEGPFMDQILGMPALHSSGTEFISELSISRTPIEGPPIFTGTLRDITQRKQA
ncbi:PAS domain S-box protein, partial [Klebsiella pneumoniae]|nr:PAS domain S-box protein [Klebsiella pneumoniae]